MIHSSRKWHLTRKILAFHSGNGGCFSNCSVPRRELGCFQLRLSRLMYARSARSDSPGIYWTRSRPMTACWWAKWHEASSHANYAVEQTGYSMSLWRVSTALKITMKPPKPGGFPSGDRTKANRHYFTVVWWLPIVGIWHRSMWGGYDLAKTDRSL